MTKHPRTSRSWDETLYQLLTRVIDAVLYDQETSMKISLVAEYVSRTSRAEFDKLRRRRRRAGTRSSSST